ncbi:MAG: hypothetical protein N4A74_19020 [Carboxylicivirga sp.]|jgi:hypothetical protein|nr:hypothetical protein [Carboxylicivirga sp.]
MNRLIFVVCILALLISCQTKYNTSKIYRNYYSNVVNGLKIDTTINYLTLSSTFIPPEYLVLKEYESSNWAFNLDSCLELFEKQISIQFSIELNHINPNLNDIKIYGISNENEYLLREKLLKYNMTEYLFLDFDSIQYNPVLCQYEQNAGINNKLIFHTVFTLPEKINDNNLELRLVFNDIFYGTGVSTFVWSEHNLKAIPKMNKND